MFLPPPEFLRLDPSTAPSVRRPGSCGHSTGGCQLCLGAERGSCGWAGSMHLFAPGESRFRSLPRCGACRASRRTDQPPLSLFSSVFLLLYLLPGSLAQCLGWRPVGQKADQLWTPLGSGWSESQPPAEGWPCSRVGPCASGDGHLLSCPQDRRRCGRWHPEEGEARVPKVPPSSAVLLPWPGVQPWSFCLDSGGPRLSSPWHLQVGLIKGSFSS